MAKTQWELEGKTTVMSSFPMNSGQCPGNQVRTLSGVALSHAAHNRRLFLSDTFSSTGNAPFGLGYGFLGRKKMYAVHAVYSLLYIDDSGQGSRLIHNDDWFCVDVNTTWIWMHPPYPRCLYSSSFISCMIKKPPKNPSLTCPLTHFEFSRKWPALFAHGLNRTWHRLLY